MSCTPNKLPPYDKHGKTTKVKADDLETSFTYDDMGRLSQRRSGDLFTSYTYDRAGRLSTLTQKRGDEQIHREDYTYDANDNILSDGTSSYTYDKLGRLIKTAEASGKTCEYSYDAFGNRTSMAEGDTAITYFYNEADQLISTSEGFSFKYDKRGNLIEKTLDGEMLNAYLYGADNRLARAKNADGETARYIYNGLGNRVSRHTEGRDTDYVLDLTKMYNNLLEADGRSFVWNEDELLFENDTPQMRDRLGSPMETGLFGVGKGNDPIGFTGYMYDEISETYFAQAREYMPGVGRFAGRDTLKGRIEIPQSLNEYVYCHNNPLSYVDYNGMEPKGAAEVALDVGVDVGTSVGSSVGSYAMNNKIDKVVDNKQTTIEREIRVNKGRIENNNRPGRVASATRELDRLKKSQSIITKVGKIGKVGSTAGFSAIGVGVDYGIDRYTGKSKTKRQSNLKVNIGYAIAGIGASSGIAIGLAATFGITGPVGWVIGGAVWGIVTIASSEYVQNKFNSLD